MQKEKVSYNEITVLSRLIAGDLKAFEQVYHYYFSRCLHFVYGYLPSIEDAEEVVQDVFIKLWEKHEQLDSEKGLSGFLFVIARNLVIDRMRRYAAMEKHQLEMKTNSIISLNSSTEQQMNFYELKEILDRLIDELPTKRRMVFKLNREKGMTYKEIADLLNISQGTVEKQMSAALQVLKERLTIEYKLSIAL
jgi:RNA polymerase sigma-70 factor (ECF subfamily)